MNEIEEQERLDLIETNNILIAKFMGGVIAGTFPDHVLLDMGKLREQNQAFWGSRNLKYHTSWDWIIPVVEKIEQLHYWVKIMGFYSFDKKYNQCSIKRQDHKTDGDYIYEYDGEWNDSKIETVWIACVKFIEWHNFNKESHE